MALDGSYVRLRTRLDAITAPPRIPRVMARPLSGFRLQKLSLFQETGISLQQWGLDGRQNQKQKIYTNN
jgi:hypothetical protein